MELWENGPQFEQSEHFRPGTDSVLLADFVNIGTRRRGIDLGCGSGILPLLLLVRSERLHMTGLEINSEAARVARENMAANALETRCDIISGDIRRCRELFKTGQFDLVVSNPPYFAAGSGRQSPNADKAGRTRRKAVLAGGYMPRGILSVPNGRRVLPCAQSRASGRRHMPAARNGL